jgi:hypothetical protein
MDKGQKSPEQEELAKKLKEITSRMELDYKLSIKDISVLAKEPYDSFRKYNKGNLPKKKLDKIRHIIAELEKQEKAMKTEKVETIPDQPENSSTENPFTVQEPIPTYKLLQCIYFPIKMDPEPYTGEFEEIGVPIKVKETPAVIAEPNDSKRLKDAEGVVPSRDPASLGCDVAIKRIDINNCAWGRLYYIFDIYNQAYLVKLFKDTTKEKFYRLVYKDPENYPEKQLHEDEILVVFRVIGTFFLE